MSQRHWDKLLEETRGPLTVIVDKTWEDIHPSDLFDTSTDPDTGLPYYDVNEMCYKIDRGDLDWFMLRARVFFEGVELGREIVGGFLYEDAREVLTDGVAEDLIYSAMKEAKIGAALLKEKFEDLEVDTIAV
jgi:hypothetical protein